MRQPRSFLARAHNWSTARILFYIFFLERERDPNYEYNFETLHLVFRTEYAGLSSRPVFSHLLLQYLYNNRISNLRLAQHYFLRELCILQPTSSLSTRIYRLLAPVPPDDIFVLPEVILHMTAHLSLGKIRREFPPQKLGRDVFISGLRVPYQTLDVVQGEDAGLVGIRVVLGFDPLVSPWTAELKLVSRENAGAGDVHQEFPFARVSRPGAVVVECFPRFVCHCKEEGVSKHLVHLSGWKGWKTYTLQPILSSI